MDTEIEANCLSAAENANLKYMAFQDMKIKEDELENCKNKLNIASAISEEKGKKKNKKDNSRVERKNIHLEQRKTYLQKEINKKIDLASYYETLAQKAREDAAKLQMNMTDEIYHMEQSIENSTSDNEMEKSAAIIRYNQEIKNAEKEYMKAKEIFQQYDETYLKLEQERDLLIKRQKQTKLREEQQKVGQSKAKQLSQKTADYEARNAALWAAYHADEIDMDSVSVE